MLPRMPVLDRLHLRLRRMKIRLHLRRAKLADAAIEELLREIERDPARVMEALRKRFPPADEI
ncbi:hypothetical protein GCM10017559_49390 [Streptosporangium longisporum]|uniref:Uncharacterized protein n=1 Tax=Streptosporangium longisporum TaxID=46187 RepID=A0ABP6KNU1_9ACTN